jgi:exosortase E/protease (VPEID-CTERM system)
MTHIASRTETIMQLNRIRRWPFLIGLVLLEVALLRYVSVLQYMPLRESPEALDQLVSLVPAAVKASLLTGAFALVVTFIRAKSSLSAGLAEHYPTRMTIALNIACFGALTALFAVMQPTGRASGSAWLAIAMRFSPILWLGLLVSWAGVVAPFAFWRKALFVNYRMLFIIFAVSFLSFHSFDAEFASAVGGALIEPTLYLTSKIYALTGEAITAVGVSPEGYPIYGSGEFFGEIGPSCSGYEGILLTVMFLGLYFFLEPRKMSGVQIGFVVLLCCLGIFLLNSVRLAMLIYIGAHYSPEIAQEGFHQNFGLLSLIVVLVIAVTSTRALTVSAAPVAIPFRDDASIAELKNDGSLRLLIPLVFLTGSSLLCGLFSGKFFWLYPLPIVTASVGLYQIRDELRSLKFSFSFTTFLLALVTFLLWLYLVPADPEATKDFQTSLFSAPLPLVAAWLIIRLLGAVIIVPLVEEPAFRGAFDALLFACFRPHLTAAAAKIGAMALTALIFGLVHSNVLAGFVAGLAFGLARWRRNELGDAILCHGLTNLMLAFYVLLANDWSYWL